MKNKDDIIRQIYLSMFKYKIKIKERTLSSYATRRLVPNPIIYSPLHHPTHPINLKQVGPFITKYFIGKVKENKTFLILNEKKVKKIEKNT